MSLLSDKYNELGKKKNNSDSMKFDDFYKGTYGDFKQIKKAPNREPDYISIGNPDPSGSKYWYEGNYVIRESDHWLKKIASCCWLLDGQETKKHSIGRIKLSDFQNRNLNLLTKSNIGKKLKVLIIETVVTKKREFPYKSVSTKVKTIEGIYSGYKIRKRGNYFYTFHDFSDGNVYTEENIATVKLLK